MSSILRFELLGGSRVLRDGVPLAGFVSAKSRALLCYLAMTRVQHARTTLAALFWGELPEEVAATNLRQAIANLRRLCDDHLVVTRTTLAFDLAAPFELDVLAFEGAARDIAATEMPAPRLLEDVLGLYAGAFLSDISIRDADEFAAW